jgi:hypothetical protein
MLPALHQAFVDRALPRLQADSRIVGVAAGGSWIDGTLDEYSDLDLVIACGVSEHAAVLRDRSTIAAGLGPLLNAFVGDHVNEPRLLICLYEPGPLHVDLKFVALDDLATRVEDPVVLWERDGAVSSVIARSPARFPSPDAQWIEDRFWTWVHYGAAKLGRGELFEVVDFLAAVRAMSIGPMLHLKHGHLPRGVRRLETVAAADLAPLMATVATYDAASCASALRAVVRLYRVLRDQADAPGLVRQARAEAAALAYLEAIIARIEF